MTEVVNEGGTQKVLSCVEYVCVCVGGGGGRGF